MKLASDFRKRAREALKGHWFVAIIAGFIASLLGGLTSNGSISFSSSSSSSGGDTIDPDFGFTGNLDIDPEILTVLVTVIGIVAVLAVVFSFIYIIIGGAVSIGYSRFNLDLVDEKDVRVGTLFDYFDEWKKAFGARILQSVYIFLWSLLFVIPGIMASFSYVMVSYVMAEHPELSAREALKESRRIMKGNRWRFFCMMFSFIGWNILTVFTLGIAGLWVVPYEQAAIAAFYRDITDTDMRDQII